jgi:hypothetical protein
MDPTMCAHMNKWINNKKENNVKNWNAIKNN